MKQRLAIWLAALTVLLLALSGAAVSQLKPAVEQLAAGHISAQVRHRMAEVLSEMLSAENTSYGDFVTVEKDGSGRVTALQSNLPLCRRLEQRMETELKGYLAELAETELTVRTGELTGVEALEEWGRLWRIPVEVKGSVAATFRNDFELAGDHQTRHRIWLDVVATLQLRLPLGRVRTEAVQETVVAETVIIGSAPYTYLYTNEQGHR